jgi:hypothetical protein
MVFMFFWAKTDVSTDTKRTLAPHNKHEANGSPSSIIIDTNTITVTKVIINIFRRIIEIKKGMILSSKQSSFCGWHLTTIK